MKRKTVLIGSFRREQDKLKTVFNQLSKKYDLLCPRTVDFVDPEEEYVKGAHELNDSVSVIEERVFEAIRKSDFVWLFAPNGYVGTSGALEIGYAHALGVPIYTDESPTDPLVSEMITGVVKTLQTVPDKIHRPGQGISGLQNYYSRIAEARGWSQESARDTMLLLTEEIGELARAIRKSENLNRDVGYGGILIEDELADVQLYLVHLANGLNINLANAVTDKEIKNAARHVKSKDK